MTLAGFVVQKRLQNLHSIVCEHSITLIMMQQSVMTTVYNCIVVFLFALPGAFKLFHLQGVLNCVFANS